MQSGILKYKMKKLTNILLALLLLSNIITGYLLYKERSNKGKSALYTEIANIFKISKQPICKNCELLEKKYYSLNTINIIDFGNGTFNIDNFDISNIFNICPITDNSNRFLLQVFENSHWKNNPIKQKEYIKGLQKIQRLCQRKEIIQLLEKFSSLPSTQ